jgi:predicted RNase H-like HicB family nuclease
MNITVLIERTAGNGYRARVGEPLPLVVEGATRDEALAKLKEGFNALLKNGAELASLELGTSAASNPWVKYAGMFKDDPDFQEVVEIIRENRRIMDEDPSIP